MPMDRQAAMAGVFLPDELALLGRVFQATKVDDETVQQRESRASRIIANFMAGVVDETELAELSRQPLGR